MTTVSPVILLLSEVGTTAKLAQMGLVKRQRNLILKLACVQAYKTKLRERS